MSIIQGTSKADGAAYDIEQSVRFNDDDSSFLVRTPGSAGNQRTWTWSAWVKRCALTLGGSNHQTLFSCETENTQIRFHAAADTLDVIFGGTIDGHLVTSQVFRDVAAFYSIVVAVDTTQSVAADRCKVYVNGAQVTDFGTETYPAQNYDGGINNTEVHNIGRSAADTSRYFDGYLAELNFIDGTAPDVTSFGKTNADGVWIPKKYSGAYGTNGFYITGATAAALGTDFSGNSNTFTSSGLATTDQMLDTPTNNFWTLNPTDPHGSNVNILDGNLRAACTSSAEGSVFAPMLPETGKWAWKITATLNMGSAAEYPILGIVPENNADLVSPMRSGGTGEGYGADGRFFSASNASNAAYGAVWADGDVIQVGWDADAGALSFWHNGTAQGVAKTGLTGRWKPAQDHYSTAGGDTLSDFGQSGYTPTDSSYKTLCTANLATPSITDGSAHSQPTLYTGNSSTLEVNQSGNSAFQPDLLWVKSRSLGAGGNHVLYDAVRGVTKEIYPSLTNAEGATNALTSFDVDGFTLLGAASGSERFNASGETYIGWQWKANGAGSANTDGTISSTVSANTTAGFSIATYTGNATASQTVGHGLGAAPKMIIIKDIGAVESWIVGHDSIGWTKNLYLNLTNAAVTSTTIWQDTAPTSSVFSLGSSDGVNAARSHVAYCFAEIPGYNSFGSYTGNSLADGPFVYCGFKPAFIMTKRTDSTSDWTIEDTTRSTFNLVENALFPNLSNAEDTTGDRMDILSNGFKLRTTVEPNVGTLIYMAFAENPFGGDGAAPATAR